MNTDILQQGHHYLLFKNKEIKLKVRLVLIMQSIPKDLWGMIINNINGHISQRLVCPFKALDTVQPSTGDL